MQYICNVLSTGYKTNIHKDTDKVVLVHAVEMHEILNSQQWYASKYWSSPPNTGKRAQGRVHGKNLCQIPSIHLSFVTC